MQSEEKKLKKYDILFKYWYIYQFVPWKRNIKICQSYRSCFSCKKEDSSTFLVQMCWNQKITYFVEFMSLKPNIKGKLKKNVSMGHLSTTVFLGGKWFSGSKISF